MDMKQIENKWQKRWEESGLNAFDKADTKKPKFYVLEMFSYPSGAKLHVGHWYNYGPTDSFARFKKMQGYNVFQPMGFDAFGLPAENYAIKTGIHPKDSTEKNIETMEGQLKAMGAMFDWSAEVQTCREDYYKWTQWMFLQLYKNGLAYRKEAPVNWCPSCNTVLANEQVKEGLCDRCGTQVVHKNLTQWFFKITQYAEELLSGLDNLDWPEKTKAMQRNWIGKSEGCEIEFECESGDKIRVFTTRCDTVCGVSYVVLAPEHPLALTLTKKEQEKAVRAYIAEAAKANEIDRLSSTREKTGVFTGSYCTNPVTGDKIPVYLADYVLASYGTGAVMAVPAHDERDFAFAAKYNLPVKRVIGTNEKLPFCEDGILCYSGKFDGLCGKDARDKIAAHIEQLNKGGKRVNYRLRDWLVSRQRYWGAPIPVIHCPDCGAVPVPEQDLPVKLPYDVEFRPDGKSPLAKCEKFMNTVCPKCGKKATRDPDTLDTFVCSSWYYLRYADAHNDKLPFSRDKVDKLLPVDTYVGGAEHSCMHLLYARFFTKVLRDLGYLDFDEPFKRLVHQGVILGPDGNRMSKSHGNVVSPDEYVNTYGSDAFRLYLMFGFSYTEGGPWSDDGIKAIAKFLDRMEKIVLKTFSTPAKTLAQKGAEEKTLDFVRNSTIQRVAKDMEAFSFNTAVARLMELVNAVYKYDGLTEKDTALLQDSVKDLLLLLAPCAPHFTEELWEQIGGKGSIFAQSYPKENPAALTLDEKEYAVQVNSKIVCRAMIANGLNNAEIQEYVLSLPEVKERMAGKALKKCIVVPNRLVNLIV
ncbi:MAG: leucine--tRNA ligase [Clostridiales bacterium]|nr:leucine--tRNA ligase [Clostridiales bacterium]